MPGLKLNLGCGAKLMPGYVNVDKFGEPDVRHDLEHFPWPWPDNSVEEILLKHVLEHLGQVPDVFLGIMKEMYRVCQADAKIRIIVPHPRHEHFLSDPTHVRAITPMSLSLFSKKYNQHWIEKKAANTPLALYLGVDFELMEVLYKPSDHWFRRHPEPNVDMKLFEEENAIYNNLCVQISMLLRAVKVKEGKNGPEP